MEAQRLLQSPGLVSVECFWLQVTKHCRNLLSPRKEVSEAEQFPWRLIQNLDNIIKGPVALPAPSLAHSASALLSDWLGGRQLQVVSYLGPATSGEEERASFLGVSPWRRRLSPTTSQQTSPISVRLCWLQTPENCSDLSQ